MRSIVASLVLFQNSPEQIHNVVSSFLSTMNFRLKLFVVDNSPQDVLREFFVDDRIVYFHNPSNTGFGSAHNIALRQSLNSGEKYHLVLNPDICFEEQVLSDLFCFMESNLDIGNLMPKVYYPDGSLQYLCKLLPTPYDWIGRRFNPFVSVVEKRNQVFELRFTNYDFIMDVPYLSGCFMFLRISALKKVGLFDENIFMYGEETDLCRRLNIAGYRTVFNPNVSIVHEFQKGSHKSWKLTWIGIKSAFYYFNKWGWIFDSDRFAINQRTLQKLSNKS